MSLRGECAGKDSDDEEEDDFSLPPAVLTPGPFLESSAAASSNSDAWHSRHLRLWEPLVGATKVLGRRATSAEAESAPPTRTRMYASAPRASAASVALLLLDCAAAPAADATAAEEDMDTAAACEEEIADEDVNK